VPDLIYAAVLSGDDLVVIRRLDASTTPARLMPENNRFPAITDFEIIGRAISFSHVFE
jgi:SOS-response transcriptional repressor LexA